MKWVILGTLALVPACTVQEAPDGRLDSAGTPALAEAVEEPLGCRYAFVRGPVAFRPWSPTDDRKIYPKSAMPHFMDDCEPAGWTAGCEIEFGGQFCMNRQWTVVCTSDAHCPNGSRCTDGAAVGQIVADYSDYGWCAPVCDAALGNNACARPDMECAPDLSVCLRIERPARDHVAEHAPAPLEPKVRRKSVVVTQSIRPPAP